jgi:hypothetical protein
MDASSVCNRGCTGTDCRTAQQAPPSPESATISSGTIFTTPTGEPVHAHGAGIIAPRTHPAGAGGKYFMVGTTQKKEPGWWI